MKLTDNLSDETVLNLGALTVALLALLILAITHGLAAAKSDLAAVDAIATTIAGGCIGFVSRGAVRSAPPAAGQ